MPRVTLQVDARRRYSRYKEPYISSVASSLVVDGLRNVFQNLFTSKLWVHVAYMHRYVFPINVT